MQLKSEIIETVRDRKDLIRNLQKEMGWSYDRTARYIRHNTAQLLHIKSLTLISENLNKPIKDLVQ